MGNGITGLCTYTGCRGNVVFPVGNEALRLHWIPFPLDGVSARVGNETVQGPRMVFPMGNATPDALWEAFPVGNAAR